MYSFKSITAGDKELFESYFDCNQQNSEANFTNLYMWKDYYKTRFCEDEGFLVVMNTSPDGKNHSYMPWGSGDIKKCLMNMWEYSLGIGEPLRITNATEEQALLFKELFPKSKIKENSSFNDYVYLTESLISLSGKKLHSKKNHLNRFKQKYENYVYRPLKKEDFKPCMVLAERLIVKDGNGDNFEYITELESINTAFENFDRFCLKGGVIEIDGNIAAFTVGEKHRQNCALIHIEKADTSYDGIYVAINNEFVKNEWQECTYVNREEDMGIPGIRKAKLSYRPDHMVRKFMCVAR